MDARFDDAVSALRTLGIETQIERNGVGHLLLTVKGEAVDSWTDSDGPWVTLVVAEGEEPDA
jgi:hypothetical protein